ncbi:hypothetical protein AMECASPLE_018113 [Ameca splendens]|uniref:Uncharacterized protein n=1 Tax=Ameca splendens TaxID=208324 RepID=A0ABV0YQY7_9TELE
MSAPRGQGVEGGGCSVYVQGGIAKSGLSLASDSICCQLGPLNFLFPPDLFDSNSNSGRLSLLWGRSVISVLFNKLPTLVFNVFGLPLCSEGPCDDEPDHTLLAERKPERNSV